MKNPFEAALHFLLKDRLRHGDGESSAQAQTHIEAIDAAKAGVQPKQQEATPVVVAVKSEAPAAKSETVPEVKK